MHMSTDKIKHWAQHYIAGLLAASFNGGISALAGTLGIAGVAAVGALPVLSLTPSQMLSAWVGGVVIHGVMWLKANPVPEKLP